MIPPTLAISCSTLCPELYSLFGRKYIVGGRPWSLFWRSMGRTNLSLTRSKPAASRRIRRQRIPYTRRTKRERRMNENDDCENITNAKCFSLSHSLSLSLSPRSPEMFWLWLVLVPTQLGASCRGCNFSFLPNVIQFSNKRTTVSCGWA